jgi:hypothetical protein
MRGTLAPFWRCHELARIVPALRDGAALADINAIEFLTDVKLLWGS